MPKKKTKRSKEEKDTAKHKRSYMLLEDTIQQIDDLKRVYKGKTYSEIVEIAIHDLYERNHEAIQSVFRRNKKTVYNWFALRVHQRIFKREDIKAAAQRADLTTEIYCIEAIAEKLGRDTSIDKIECAYLLEVGEEALSEYRNNPVSYTHKELWAKMIGKDEPDV